MNCDPGLGSSAHKFHKHTDLWAEFFLRFGERQSAFLTEMLVTLFKSWGPTDSMNIQIYEQKSVLKWDNFYLWLKSWLWVRFWTLKTKILQTKIFFCVEVRQLLLFLVEKWIAKQVWTLNFQIPWTQRLERNFLHLGVRHFVFLAKN